MAAKAKKKKSSRGPRKRTARQKAKAARDLGQRLSEARAEAGLSQAEVARAVRLSPSLVSKIERGERPLDPLELSRFARLYEKSIVDFIG